MPILRAEAVHKTYRTRGRSSSAVYALRGVSLSIQPGQTLGVVGESGCGKSTLARVLVGLETPSQGRLLVHEQDVAVARRRAQDALMRQVQMVFQSPATSLDPRMSVRQIIREPMDVIRPRIPRGAKGERVNELLGAVGLPEEIGGRRPTALSGGQQQRVALARALSSHAKVIVCDEVVSALDVSIQAQVVNLLRDMQQQTGVSYVFIAHDLSVVATIAHHVAVMYFGRVVEYGAREQIYGNPQHPYTRALLSSVPVPDPALTPTERIVLTGDLPSPTEIPTGCPFRTRCWQAQDICAHQDPPLAHNADASHEVACHFPMEM
ncbi:ABC transporter ATP-binding protein [Dactylosporangium sp. CA-233914]|uniref:ABC transporter ATP-binding protein n=1 Tax=Dactylosporangium sp. CA-233914 TaxID=3239934 RepID=UPI003D8F5A8E